MGVPLHHFSWKLHPFRWERAPLWISQRNGLHLRPVSRAYLTVTIDTECDKGARWKCERPIAFTGVTRGIPDRLSPLFRMYAAKPTYLLSPEVMRDAASVETLAALGANADLGSHLHGEFAEPDAFEPEETTMFQRDYPKEVERAKLTYLTDLFRNTFGRHPRTFRAGRFGIGPNSIGLLSELGYEVESSVTPGLDWASSGAKGLSFPDAPTQPYRPNAEEPWKRGDAALLEVPVTIRSRAAQKLPLVGKWIEARWLRPTRGSEEEIVAVAKDEITDATTRDPNRPVVLTAMFHNVEVVPGKSPYASNEDEANQILKRLAALLSFAKKENIAVVGLSEIPGLL